MKSLGSLCCLLLIAATASAAEPAVQLDKHQETVHVTIGGEPFAVYNFGEDLPKPYFSPVRGPHGKIITRPIEKPGDDHPHHKGIWVAVDKVNGVRFWDEQGPIENVSVDLLKADGNPAKMKVVNRWRGKQGEPILIEKTTITVAADRTLTYDITLKPAKEQVTFGDTKEGFFGFRMVDTMREEEGGHVINADGLQGAGPCWGKVSDWVDYYGPVEGNTVGLAIFDHPQNFRPGRYHVRNYGLFSISPFGPHIYSRGQRPKDPVILQPDDSLHVRYAMFIHAGDTKQGEVASRYRTWLKAGH